MKRLFSAFILVGALAVISSCSKSKLDLTSQNAYSFDSYFSTPKQINEATIATYSTLVHTGLWAREYYYIFDLLGHDAKKTVNMQGDMAQLATMTYASNNPVLAAYWKSLYRMIFRANVTINRANAINTDNESDIDKLKQYVAEAKFLRAYAYFNIVNTYGAAPLITSYDSMRNNNYAPRTAAADIWSFIESELSAAQQDLPVTYAVDDLGRVTKGAATALLGKAYLYEKKWQQAQTELAKLTAAPYSYSLAPVYDSLFTNYNQTNPETIFQVMNVRWTNNAYGDAWNMFDGQETWGGKASQTARAREYGFNDWNNTFITTAAVNTFSYANPQTGAAYIDPRAKSTFYGDAASGGETVFCRKCDIGQQNFNFAATGDKGGYKWKKYQFYDEMFNTRLISGINGQVIRYADILLMLAETYVQQGSTGAEPLRLINEVRTRAGAVNYSSLGSQSNAMDIIKRERRLELTGEQSRWFDLVRWGIAKETINAERAAEAGDGTQPFEDKHVLFPIPDVEKNYNPYVAGQVSNGWN